MKNSGIIITFGQRGDGHDLESAEMHCIEGNDEWQEYNLRLEKQMIVYMSESEKANIKSITIENV